jgi:hypothetical protein
MAGTLSDEEVRQIRRHAVEWQCRRREQRAHGRRDRTARRRRSRTAPPVGSGAGRHQLRLAGLMARTERAAERPRRVRRSPDRHQGLSPSGRPGHPPPGIRASASIDGLHEACIPEEPQELLLLERARDAADPQLHRASHLGRHLATHHDVADGEAAAGLRTRNASRITCGLSTARLMTQLEMITSTESSGSGICSICPLRNVTFFTPAASAFLRARVSIWSVMSRPKTCPRWGRRAVRRGARRCRRRSRGRAPSRPHRARRVPWVAAAE